jgi:hypothetical protein
MSTFDGQDVKPYADDLKGYGFPAPSSDGMQLLIMRLQPGKAPEPRVLPIDAGQAKPANTVSPQCSSVPPLRAR